MDWVNDLLIDALKFLKSISKQQSFTLAVSELFASQDTIS